jgi:hypothetical protein
MDLSTLFGLVAGVAAIISGLAGIFTSLHNRRTNREVDAIANQPTPSLPSDSSLPEPSPPEPVFTSAEKIDALFMLSKHYQRNLFLAYFFWASFGIFVGYLAGNFLPH